jgi:phage gpG-like protein
VSGSTLIIGSNETQAAIQNYGGQAGRGRRVTIPARPILVVQDEDIEDMIDILDNYVFHF